MKQFDVYNSTHLMYSKLGDCRVGMMTNKTACRVTALPVTIIAVMERSITRSKDFLWSEDVEFLTGLANGDSERNGSYPAGSTIELVDKRLRELVEKPYPVAYMCDF